MDFGALWSVGFYAVRDLDVGNFGTKRGVFLLEEFLQIVRNI